MRGCLHLYSEDVGHPADGTIKGLLGELVNVRWWLSLTRDQCHLLKVAPTRENPRPARPVRRAQFSFSFGPFSPSSPSLGVAHAHSTDLIKTYENQLIQY